METGTLKNTSSGNLNKLGRFQIPNYFKKIGWGLAVLAFGSLIINKYSLDNEALKTFGKYGMLLGVFLVSMSKDKIEDEFISSLRMRSYSVAFIAGVLYAFVLPLLDYLIDFARFVEGVTFKQVGDFLILWILITIQVFYFEYLKRTYQ